MINQLVDRKMFFFLLIMRLLNGICSNCLFFVRQSDERRHLNCYFLTFSQHRTVDAVKNHKQSCSIRINQPVY